MRAGATIAVAFGLALLSQALTAAPDPARARIPGATIVTKKRSRK
jgi:hypothetical protein